MPSIRTGLNINRWFAKPYYFKRPEPKPSSGCFTFSSLILHFSEFFSCRTSPPLYYLFSSQNPHPIFHKVLILAFSCAIVSLLSFSGSLFFYTLSPGRLFFQVTPGLLVFYLSSPGCDPGIHKETGKELVVRWIAGSSPELAINANKLLIRIVTYLQNLVLTDANQPTLAENVYLAECVRSDKASTRLTAENIVPAIYQVASEIAITKNHVWVIAAKRSNN